MKMRVGARVFGRSTYDTHTVWELYLTLIMRCVGVCAFVMGLRAQTAGSHGEHTHTHVWNHTDPPPGLKARVSASFCSWERPPGRPGSLVLTRKVFSVLPQANPPPPNFACISCICWPVPNPSRRFWSPLVRPDEETLTWEGRRCSSAVQT